MDAAPAYPDRMPISLLALAFADGVVGRAVQAAYPHQICDPIARREPAT